MYNSDEEIRNIFKTNLKTMRESKGKRVSEVSREVGISYSYLRELEDYKETKSPSFETLTKLANYYDVKVYLFFTE